jgi:hypothetical protein
MALNFLVRVPGGTTCVLFFFGCFFILVCRPRYSARAGSHSRLLLVGMPFLGGGALEIARPVRFSVPWISETGCPYTPYTQHAQRISSYVTVEHDHVYDDYRLT